LWERLLYFRSNAQKYIAAIPNGYKTDLVMFFQISRTMQRKHHVKRNFLQEFRLQNCPITPKNGEKPLKIGLITIKTKKNSYKPTL
jgi:hypothetical protein